mgnify:CR=1 FL=1
MDLQVRTARPEDAAELARLSAELGCPCTAEDAAWRLQRMLALG